MLVVMESLPQEWLTHPRGDVADSKGLQTQWRAFLQQADFLRQQSAAAAAAAAVPVDDSAAAIAGALDTVQRLGQSLRDSDDARLRLALLAT
jgi:hypothetical protein